MGLTFEPASFWFIGYSLIETRVGEATTTTDHIIFVCFDFETINIINNLMIISINRAYAKHGVRFVRIACKLCNN